MTAWQWLAAAAVAVFGWLAYRFGVSRQPPAVVVPDQAAEAKTVVAAKEVEGEAAIAAVDQAAEVAHEEAKTEAANEAGELVEDRDRLHRELLELTRKGRPPGSGDVGQGGAGSVPG